MMPRATLCVLTVATTLLVAACQQSGPAARSQSAPSSSTMPTEYGVVVGQIEMCYGDTRLLATPPPAHPAGTVVVLRGTITWVPDSRGGSSLHFPTESVTSESIPQDGQFRFVVPPRSYVLVPEPLGMYTSVTVLAGQTINTQDLPVEPCR